MQVKNICTKNVQRVTPDQSLVEVARRMEEFGCGSILVYENDKLTGVITDRDIVLRCVAKDKEPKDMTAKECQTPQVLYCYEEEQAEDVLDNMADNKVRRMVVLDNEDNKNLVGIISFGDLSAAVKNKEVSGEAMEKIRNAA